MEEDGRARAGDEQFGRRVGTQDEAGEKIVFGFRLDGSWAIHFGNGRPRERAGWERSGGRLPGVVLRRAAGEDGRSGGGGDGDGPKSLSRVKSSAQYLHAGGVWRVMPEGLDVQGGGGSGV